MKITRTESKIQIRSDYSATFVTAAKKLGGKWNADNKSWDFDIADEDRVKALLRKVYGEDGETAVETVRVEIALNKMDWSGMPDGVLELFGRTLLQRRSRDYAVTQHDSVLVISGGFARSGGSAKYPRLAFAEETVIEVKSVPFELAEKAVSDYPEAVRIIGVAKIDRVALETEKAKLLSRLAEIEKLLAPTPASNEG